MGDDSIERAIGRLQGMVKSMQSTLELNRDDKKEIYARLDEMEHAIASLPTEEEWILIKTMAMAQADKAKFWSDMRRAIASKGLIAVLGFIVVYFWDFLVIGIKSKLGG